MEDRKIVSVFGSSLAEPGSPDYEQARELGRLLAEAGYTVMTGGYGGTMEGASRGAREGGGHVIGVTVGLFEKRGFRTGPNPYVDEVIHYETLSDRLGHLVAQCGAAVALPGGIGTLSEIALTWSLLQVGEIDAKPLIVMGKQWSDLLSLVVGRGDYIRPEHTALVKTAQSPEEVLQLLERWE